MKTCKLLILAILALATTGCFEDSGSSSDSGRSGTTPGNGIVIGGPGGDIPDDEVDPAPEFAELQMVGPFVVPREHPNSRPIRNTVRAHVNDAGLAAVVWQQYQYPMRTSRVRFIKGDAQSQLWDETSLDNSPLLGTPQAIHVGEDGTIVVVMSAGQLHGLPQSGTYAWEYRDGIGWSAPTFLSDGLVSWSSSTKDTGQFFLLTTPHQEVLRFQDGAWDNLAELDRSKRPVKSRNGALAFIGWNAETDSVVLRRAGPSGEIDGALWSMALPRDHLQSAAAAVSNDGQVATVWNDGEAIRIITVPGVDTPPEAPRTVFDFNASGLNFAARDRIDVAYTPGGDIVIVAAEGGFVTNPLGPLHVFISDDGGQSWEHETYRTSIGIGLQINVNAAGELFIETGRCNRVAQGARRGLHKRDKQGRWTRWGECFGNSVGTFINSKAVTPVRTPGGVIAEHRELFGSEVHPDFSGPSLPETRNEQEMRLWFFR